MGIHLKQFLKGILILSCMIVYWALVASIAYFFTDFYKEYHKTLFYSTVISSFCIFLILVFYFYQKSVVKSLVILLIISAPYLIFLLLLQLASTNLSRLTDVFFILLGVAIVYIIVRKQQSKGRQLLALMGYCFMLIPAYPVVYDNVSHAVFKNNLVSDRALGEFDLKITDRKGQNYKVSDFSGKTVFIDMWASSCGNCIASMPKFETLNVEFKKNDNFKIISLYCPVNRDQTYEWFKKYIEKKFNYHIDYYYIDYETFKKLNIWKFPEFLIINKKNNLVYRGQIAYESYVYDNIYDKLKSINATY